MVNGASIRLLALGLLLAAGPLLVAASAEDKPPADIAAPWQGTLELGVAKLRLVFDFKKKDGGGFTGSLDSPDQAVFGLPIDEVIIADKTVKLTLKRLAGSYEGQLSEDGKQIDGKWKQGGQSLALVLRPGQKIAAARRPQEPKPPYPYTSRRSEL